MSPAAAPWRGRLAPDQGRPARRLAPNQGRPQLRVLPGGKMRRPRAPFVVLVLTLLGAGLVGLLLLNTGLQQGSFEIRDLERDVQLLRDRHTEIAQRVARTSAPDELAERADSLGMVPAERREFLVLYTGGGG